MICEQGKVVAIENEVAVVEVIQQSSCQACSAKSACGTQLASKLFQSKRHYLKLPFAHLDQAPAIGDAVEIEINDSAVLISSALVYCLPLLLMMLLAFSASRWFVDELWAVLFAGIGFTLGLLSARWIGQYVINPESFQPKLSKILSKAALPVDVISVQTSLDA